MGRLLILLGCTSVLLASNCAAAQQSTGAHQWSGAHDGSGQQNGANAGSWSASLADTVTQPGSGNAQAAMTFVVAGDVARPDAYVATSHDQLMLRDVIQQAGWISESASVLVIRNLEGRGQWSEIITRSGSSPGTEIQSGDVLLVTTTSVPDQATFPNCVFMAGQSAFVIALDPSGKTRIQAGDVLARLEADRMPNQELQLLSGAAGRSRNGVGLDFELRHGDILISREANHSAYHPAAVAQGFAPQVTEWAVHSPISSASVPTSPNASTGTWPIGFAPASSAEAPQLSVPAVPSGSNTGFPALSAAESPGSATAGVSGSYDSAGTYSAVHQNAASSHDGPFSPDRLSQPLGNGAVSVHDHGLSPLRTASLNSLPDEDAVPVSRAAEGSAFAVADTQSAPLPPADANEVLNRTALQSPEVSDSDEVLSESSSTAIGQTQTGIWNTVFVVGLILAGVLIVGGWLKSESEMRQQYAEGTLGSLTDVASSTAATSDAATFADQRTAPNHQPAQNVPRYRTLEEQLAAPASTGPGTPTEQTNAVVASSTAESAPRMAASPQPVPAMVSVSDSPRAALTSSPADGLVAPPLVRQDEWFSRDWIPASVVEPLSAHKQVGSESTEVVANRDGSVRTAADSKSDSVNAVLSAAHTSMDRWATENRDATGRELPVTADVSGHQSAVQDQPGTVAASDADTDRTPGRTAGHLVGVPEDVEIMPGEQPAAEVSSARPVSGFEELTDLIENRLPTDLCEARLPLRISLFGAPAGPRRLRIDAAHRQLAGPHTPRSTERRRPMQSVAATSEPAAAEHENSGGNFENAAPAKGAAEPDGPVPERAAGSLDRALSFLNEQAHE